MKQILSSFLFCTASILMLTKLVAQNDNPVIPDLNFTSGSSVTDQVMDPEFLVDPLSIEIALEPNAQTTVILNLSNPGTLGVNWTANTVVFPPGNSKDFLDVQFQYPYTGIPGYSGIECDGSYFYIGGQNSASILKFSIDGTYIETFTIPGIQGLNDLAYDGTFFYGSNGNTTVYKMDFDQHVLISTITAPQNVLALVYDNDNDVFYSFSWGGDIIAFDPDGILLATLPVGPGAINYTGLAYDNVTEDGPYLWAYGMVGTDLNVLVQYHLPSMMATGFSVKLNDILPEPILNLSGGLFIQPGIFPNTYTLGGMVAGEWIWGLELAEYMNLNWISVGPASGTLGAGETTEMTVFIDATDLYPWNYGAQIQFSTTPDVGSPVVDVSLTIEGEPVVGNLSATVNCTDVNLGWETMPPEIPVDSFHVYRDNALIATAYDTSYVDSMLMPETDHQYCVTAYFFNGWESDSTNTVNITIPLPSNLEPLGFDGWVISPNIVCFSWAIGACLLPDFYNIYRDGVLLASINEPYFCDTLTGTGLFEYYVEAVYYFGSSGPSNSFFILIDETAEQRDNEIKIFPNPVTDRLVINSTETIERAQLFDNLGSRILEIPLNSTAMDLIIPQVDPGVYLLKLYLKNSMVIRKIVIR